MTDLQIIDLYWARNEDAIGATDARYGSYCHTIAHNILSDHRDCSECVNDTYLRAWHTMPPQRPNKLSVFLGKITRNLALDRWRADRTQKRGGNQVAVVLNELRDCVPAPNRTEQVIDDLALAEALNRFLTGLKPQVRKLFLGRYWYLRTVRELSADYGWTESRVKMTLKRTRDQLRTHLEQESANKKSIGK